MDYIGERTNRLYSQLKKEANNDVWQVGAGIFIWPVFLALEGGDGPNATEYSQLKGEYEALRHTMISKKCRFDSNSPEQILQEAEEKDKSS